MNSTGSTDATSSANSSNNGAGGQKETVAAAPEVPDHAARDHLTAITGAYRDPALLAVLEALRAPAQGEQSPVWSVLNDSERLRAVADTGLLDPGPHTEVDQVLSLTVEAVGIPNAALNMITDVEQVSAGIASRSGDVSEQQTHPLADSLCVYTVVSGAPLIIDDITDHPVLGDHSASRSGVVRAYIGIPIIDSAGQAVGTLCAWDTEPRHWSSGDIQIMTDLADVVQNAIFDQ